MIPDGGPPASGDSILYGPFSRQVTMLPPPAAPVCPEVFTAKLTLVKDEGEADALEAETGPGGRTNMVLHMVVCEGEHSGLPVVVKLCVDPPSHVLRRLVSELFPSSDGSPFYGELKSETLQKALSETSVEAEMEYRPDGEARMLKLLPKTIRPLH